MLGKPLGWYPLVTWLAGKPPFFIGDTSSNGGFPIAMLVDWNVPLRIKPDIHLYVVCIYWVYLFQRAP